MLANSLSRLSLFLCLRRRRTQTAFVASGSIDQGIMDMEMGNYP